MFDHYFTFWNQYRHHLTPGIMVSVLLGGLGLVGMISGLALVYTTGRMTLNCPVLTNSTPETVVVDVSGSVVKPGMYTLPREARVADALVQAGGTTAQVDVLSFSQQINLAELVNDGQKIFIPFKREEACIGKTPSHIVDGPISINHASETELQQLTGIGAVRAQEIVSHRPFSALDDLVEQKIIPKSIFEQIKDEIQL